MSRKNLANPFGSNVGLTEKEIQERKRIRQLKKELGLLPFGYICYDPPFPEPKPGRFSSIYETEGDFLNAKMKAFEMINNTGNVSDELYNSIKATLNEIRPIYGKDYEYIVPMHLED